MTSRRSKKKATQPGTPQEPREREVFVRWSCPNCSYRASAYVAESDRRPRHCPNCDVSLVEVPLSVYQGATK
jgi:hypothetical protein